MPGFASLSNELLSIISAHLSNADIKNLRLAGRDTADCIYLRLQRVFLSPNRRNIEVFRAVANHKVYRHRVREIIWDAAHLENWFKDPEWATKPTDFESRCYGGFGDIIHRKHLDKNLPHHVLRQKQLDNKLSFVDCALYYHQLWREQCVILEQKLDAKAFEYGLERFQNLSRVTITPATHGNLFIPLYKTPMIRSFPYGFVYPIPQGWPRTYGMTPALKWSTVEEINEFPEFRQALSSLAARNHSVTELVVDVNQLLLGISCHFLDQPLRDYENLLTLVKKPGFRRLELVFTVGEYWAPYSLGNGLLRQALAGPADLEHIHLETDIIGDPGKARPVPPANGIEDFVPLLDIFPIDNWPRLRHFGLSGFYVTQDDLLDFLGQLPPTIKSIELSRLQFELGCGNYSGLLHGMRDRLGWQDRAGDARIRVTICIHASAATVEGRRVWLEEEVGIFLYDKGRDPFTDASGYVLDEPAKNCAGTERDAFMPEHERPWATNDMLRKMGLVKTRVPRNEF